MQRSRLVVALCALALTSTAGAASFDFPGNLTGFSGRVQSGYRPGGPMDTFLKKENAICPHIGIYEYTDGESATAGLRAWMTAQHLTATEHTRSETTSIWTAENEDVELVGTWLAPEQGLPGRLELCAITAADREAEASSSSGTHSHHRIRLGWILGLLGGIGALGTRLGQWTDRVRGIQNDPPGDNGPLE